MTAVGNLDESTVLQLCPLEHSISINDLACATHFLLQGKIVDLDAVIEHYREAVQHCPSEHPDRSTFYNNLANTVNTRFDRLGNVVDLEEAIECHRDALRLCPPGHLNRPSFLIDLSLTLSTRFEQQGIGLEEVIECNREALQLCPPGHPDRPNSLVDLARALKIRFEQQDNGADLDEAIRCSRQSLQLCPPKHPNRSYSLNLLARALRTRFEQQKNIVYLEEAINCNRESLELCPPGHPNRVNSLIDIANALRTRFEQKGANLEEAIKFNREALELCPPGHPNRTAALINLSYPLQSRFSQQGNIADLEEAINCNREALELCPLRHPKRFTSLVNLSLPLQTRFSQQGNIADLEEAVKCNRDALWLCPQGHPNRYHSLVHLANAITSRFLRQGNIADLEEAVKCGRDALQLCPQGHPNRYWSLINLANAINTLFEHLNNIEDLEEAIKYYHEALQLCPAMHPNRYSSLNHLANAMRAHFLRQPEHNIADLEQAIRCHRQALDLCPLGHPNRFASLINLANDLRIYFEQPEQGNIADLEEAIKCNRESLLLCPPGHLHRSLSLGSLANAVSTRFRFMQQPNMMDLEEAIKYYDEAIGIISLYHPLRTTLARELADAYICSYNITRNQADVDRAFRLYKWPAERKTASPWEGFRTCLQWISAARRHSHKSIVHAYSTCLTLLQRCTLTTPNISLQHDTLARGPKSLASDAAAYAIQDDDLETAIELLEQGRSILWSRLSGYRLPLEKLREVNGELAKEVEKIGRKLESMAAVSYAIPDGDAGTSMDDDAHKYRLLSESWDLVVSQIRRIPAFSTFLEAEPFANLRKAATNGPVIIINISEFRSDAIIIQNSGDPILVNLPGATPGETQTISANLAESLKPGGHNKRRDWEIGKILRRIWDLIVGPVVRSLKGTVTEGSRIWWCPTSTACSLPLHAAGPWKGENRNLPDIFISSYTPTLSALATAYTHQFGLHTTKLPRNERLPRLLAIGVPKSMGFEDLNSVLQELSHIKEIAPHVKLSQDEDATRDSVIRDIRDHSWVHFSCHGEQDIVHPFDSSFYLHDKPLTLYDIIQARLSNPEFAFLSACHTAQGDGRTPDETIHLAAGLQFAGFQSVVGTLWAMADEDGPQMATVFYEYMFRATGQTPDCRRAAAALNIATQNLRKLRKSKVRWVNFIHIGV